MARAKKLPSGKWRCRAYVKNSDGTVERPSFTANTRVEAERLAREYELEKERLASVCNYTVSEAVERYISSKEQVLSPSTIRGYRSVQREYIYTIGHISLRDISSANLQEFVSYLVQTGKSPKTIRNAYGLISSTLSMFIPDRNFRVTLPSKRKVEYSTPTDAEVRTLLDKASPYMKKIILLASIGTLRRGEISALKYSDIDYEHCSIRVHADMVLDDKSHWIYKDHPKTDDSNRAVQLPKEVIDLLGYGDPDGFIVRANPNTITRRFMELRDSLGLHCRFHDLRHYSASIRATLQPRAYTAADGGWNPGSNVLDTVYTNTLDDKRREYREKVNNYFVEKLLSSEDSGHVSAQNES